MTEIKVQVEAVNRRLVGGTTLVSNNIEFAEVVSGEINNGMVARFNLNNISNSMAATFDVGKIVKIRFEDEETSE